MAEQNNYQPSAFWFGFAMGTITLGIGAFLFGTKKGRSTVKKMLDLTDNLEENAILLFQELEEHFESTPIDKTKEVEKKEGTLDSIMHRMKHLSPDAEKQGKRFFTKE